MAGERIKDVCDAYLTMGDGPAALKEANGEMVRGCRVMSVAWTGGKTAESKSSSRATAKDARASAAHAYSSWPSACDIVPSCVWHSWSSGHWFQNRPSCCTR